MAIRYRIKQIRTPQFAIFPENYIKEEKSVDIQATVNFYVHKSLGFIKCTIGIEYAQKNKVLLKIVVECVFELSPDAVEEITKTKVVKVDVLRYIATIAVGATRGVIAAKTENTELNNIVLPPINLVDLVKEDLVLKDSEPEK